MNIWQILSSFPSVIPSFLLGVLLIYWLMAIVGLVDHGHNLEAGGGHDHDFGHHDAHHDLHHGGHTEHDDSNFHTIASYLVALGLGGVPFSIVLSLLAFFTWLLTALAQQYVLAMLPGSLLHTLAGCAVLLLAAAMSIPISARLVKPMRGLFVKHHARSNSSLVGLSCKIVTQSVDEGFGRAEVSDHGTSLNIRVWAKVPNKMTKNSSAIILSYDEESQQYEVQAAPLSV